MPSRTAVQEVKDNVLVYKQEICLNLLVESVRQIHIALVSWPRLGPFSADSAGLADFGHHIQNSLSYVDFVTLI